MNNGIYS